MCSDARKAEAESQLLVRKIPNSISITTDAAVRGIEAQIVDALLSTKKKDHAITAVDQGETAEFAAEPGASAETEIVVKHDPEPALEAWPRSVVLSMEI